MPAPAFPPDEAARLAALHALRLLDTPPEGRFDRITRLAARALGVPIALVSLVDADRQYFKSACGLDAREGPRATSFCGHAILGATPLVVSDATADPRFADNPAVTGELHVRAYAGQPLRGPGGHLVGTLCVVDTTARGFDAEDLAVLADLATMVEAELTAVALGGEVGRMRDRQVADARERDLLTAQAEELVAQKEELAAQAEALVASQERLQEEQLRLHAVLDTVAAGIAAVDANGAPIFANRRMGEVAGLPAGMSLTEGMARGLVTVRSAALGRELVPADMALAAILRGEGATEDELAVRHADGRIHAVLVSTRLLRDAGGEVRGAVFAMHDVSERARAQVALRASEDRFRLLAEAAFEGIAIVEGGRITHANAALARLLGHDAPQDLVGLLATDIAAPESRELVMAHVRNGFEGAYEAVVLRRDGGRMDVEVMARVVEQDGRAVRVTAMRDIGARKALDRAKEQFVAVVSHDLRNPLNALALSLSMLEDEVVPGLAGDAHQDATYALDVAQKSVKRLIRLTEDLLDGERLATGQVPFRHAEVPAHELLAEAAAAMRAQAAQAGVAIAVAPTDARVWGDPDKLMQVLANLVGNAIKFSPAGGTVRLAADAGPAGVTLRVADEGRGVPADKREAIFERFVQVEPADATEKGGAGLGLAICRAIVDRHGGRIWVDSEVGRGSTFQVALPAPEAG